MGLTAASYFSRRQVGGWVELWRISVQRSLRLISLSNYVFVLEISQISGIVQNVSVLIMVVMRIVAAVEEEKKKKREMERKGVTGPESSPALRILLTKYKYLEMGDEVQKMKIHWENVTFCQ